MRRWLFMLLLCGILQACAQQPPRPLVIRDVTVIDCTGAKPQAEMTVVFANGRIAEIGKVAEAKVPRGAQIVDGKGKFLIPGLWDMHGHLTDAGEGSLAQLIENGVTGVRDMGGDMKFTEGAFRNRDYQLAEQKAALASGKVLVRDALTAQVGGIGIAPGGNIN